MHIIAGLFRHRRLITPKGANTRPTASRLREAIFNICQNEIEGSRFLDLFAGSGAMGFEALSRGAKEAIFIENDREAIRCIQQNAELLNVKNRCQIIQGNVLSQLKKLKSNFEIIFADPPYHTYIQGSSTTYSEKVIEIIDHSQLLVSNGILFIEEAFSTPPKPSLTSLEFENSRRMGEAVLQIYRKAASN